MFAADRSKRLEAQGIAQFICVYLVFGERLLRRRLHHTFSAAYTPAQVNALSNN